jgi:hypothetical protein
MANIFRCQSRLSLQVACFPWRRAARETLALSRILKELAVPRQVVFAMIFIIMKDPFTPVIHKKIWMLLDIVYIKETNLPPWNEDIVMMIENITQRSHPGLHRSNYDEIR